MKKIVALLLSLILVLSLCAVPVYAETEEKTDKDVAVIIQTIACVYTCLERGLLNDAQCSAIASMFDLNQLKIEGHLTDEESRTINMIIEAAFPESVNYSFGQGIFVVGQDLKAGTYDITCKSASDENLSSSMSDFSDIYSGYGMDDYASMFGSLGTMYDSITGMTVTTYDKSGMYDNYLTLKVNETARIILEDGGKLEISGGSAELTFIR